MISVGSVEVDLLRHELAIARVACIDGRVTDNPVDVTLADVDPGRAERRETSTSACGPASSSGASSRYRRFLPGFGALADLT